MGLYGELTRATGHQLDLARTLSQLLSRAQPNLIGTVGNRRNAFDLGVTQRTTRQSRNFEGRNGNLHAPRFVK